MMQLRHARMPLALVMVGGCLQPSSINCDNGDVCPPGFRCAIVHDSFGDTSNKEVCVPPSCAAQIKHGNCDNPPSHDGCSSRCSLERPVWTTIDAAPQRRIRHAMAYDAARGVLVVFGGDLVPIAGLPSSACPASSDSPTATWEWDGAIWRRRTSPTTPPAHAGHAMAYDAFRERVVMFGGDSTGRGSTWEWDGSDWSESTPVTAPPAWLSDAAMAYDAGRRRVVLFGGRNVEGGNGVDEYQGRTWEWDGVTWSERDTLTSPSPRAAPAMTYDSKRGALVLFGGVRRTGRNEVTPLGDTWQFDGTNWMQLSAAGPPPPRGYAGIAFDAPRRKIVMFGGATGSHPNSLYTDTWEWDGSQWTANAANATNTAPQMVAPMAFDIVRGKVVLFGGSLAAGDGQITNDTWEWDGEVWTKQATGCASGGVAGASTLSERPPPRAGQAMAYDTTRAMAVMFGGRQGGTYLGDTWSWNGSAWRVQAVARPPLPRAEHAMAFDAARNVTVMFGGIAADPSGAITRFDDTWLWDGTTWTEQSPASRPATRSGHAMVYDAARNVILLIGGNSAEAPLLEQCTWDGVSWACSTPDSSPPTRTDFAVAYDAARQRVVLFGGEGPLGLQYDTWEWDGSVWENRSTMTGPSGRAGPTLGYDAMLQRVVLSGGQGNEASLNDIWEWDGTSWIELSPDPGPSHRHHASMVYDVARESLMMFGGDDDTMVALGDTWFVRYEDPAVPYEACHTGLDYDGDGLVGCDDPDCVGLCAHCGDGVCDESEGCGLCPRDCGGACSSVCGDLQCGLGETCTSCPGDCGPCSTCGDDHCDPRETCSSCPMDCGPCNKTPPLSE